MKIVLTLSKICDTIINVAGTKTATALQEVTSNRCVFSSAG
ncbi:hypothetical protein [Clostridium butyricum]